MNSNTNSPFRNRKNGAPRSPMSTQFPISFSIGSNSPTRTAPATPEILRRKRSNDPDMPNNNDLPFFHQTTPSTQTSLYQQQEPQEQQSSQRMKKSRTDMGIASALSVRLMEQKLRQHQQQKQSHSSSVSTASTSSFDSTSSSMTSHHVVPSMMDTVTRPMGNVGTSTIGYLSEELDDVSSTMEE